jgi:hypothetical protein
MQYRDIYIYIEREREREREICESWQSYPVHDLHDQQLRKIALFKKESDKEEYDCLGIGQKDKIPKGGKDPRFSTLRHVVIS